VVLASGVGALLASLLLLNRGVSQLPIGPIYLLDATLVAAMMGRPLRTLRTGVRFWPALVLIAMTLGWLALEAQTGALDALAVRRAATGIYAFVPVVLWVYRREAFGWILRYPAIAAVVVAVGTATVGGAAASVSAQVAAGLAVAALADRHLRWRACQVGVILTVFGALVAGLLSPGSSPFRTPVASAFAAVALLVLFAALHAVRVRRARLSALIALAIVAAAFSASLALQPVQASLGTVIAAAGGVTGSEWLTELALDLNPDRSRSRGDAVGTGRERLGFWRDILRHNLASDVRFLIGSGHAQSFFDAVRPGDVFLDQHLLEPHNSFFGVFFRYGLVGVAALVALIVGVVSRGRAVGHAAAGWWAASLAVALVYASFEVALESPHGAVVFWSLVILPFSVADQPDAGRPDRRARRSARASA